MAAYDRAANYKPEWQRELTERKSALSETLGVMRAWLPLIVRDIPNFDASAFGDRREVPEDILSDAERLFDTVTGYTGPSGQPLSYAQRLADALGIEDAVREMEEAEKADKTYQGLLAEARATNTAFAAEIKLFRRTLLAVLGRNSKDYQKLRAARAKVADEDDDAAAPPPPTPVTPADPGAETPA